MKLFLLMAARNVFRNRARAILTIVGVATTILAFVMIRTLLSAWSVGADYAAKDRIATRHKVTFVMQLPKKYMDDIRGVKGVSKATWANWFGAKDPRHPDEFFANLAVEPASFLEVYSEISLPEAEKQAWLTDKQGVIIGDVLAKKLGLKVGSKITLEGTIYPGDWEFRVVGVYTATDKSIDRSQFLFHWDYMNDALPAARKDQIGWAIARIDDPARSTAISGQIDRIFEDRDVQTVTMSERNMQLSFMAMVSALLRALDVVSVIILLIMMMILGNTIAMGVRERTREFAVLRAVGFRPGHVVAFILGEAVFLGAIGGLVGLGLSIPIVEYGLGRWIEENMGSWFPYFRIDSLTKVLAVAAAIVLGLVASVIPAVLAGRLKVVDALRRVA